MIVWGIIASSHGALGSGLCGAWGIIALGIVLSINFSPKTITLTPNP